MRGLKEKIKEAWARLRRLEATPHQIALGLAVGVFVSFFPIIPLQTVAALALVFVVGGNTFSCMIGLHLHDLVFPLLPLMFMAEYEVGRMSRPLGLHPHFSAEPWSLADLIHHGWPVLRAMFIGAAILGSLAAAAAYLIGRAAARDWQKRRLRAG